MISLLLISLISAAPRVELVERNSMGVDARTAALLRDRVRKAMLAEGLDATMADQPCSDSACLREVARTHGLVAVGMTIAKSRRGFTIDLEALDPNQTVLQRTFIISSERVEQSPEAQLFARELSVKIAPPDPAPVVVSDVPKKDPEPVQLAPTRTAPEFVEERPTPAAPRVVLIAGAVVVAAGVAMIIGGAVSAGQLEKTLQAPVVTSLTRPQAMAQADGANALVGVGSAAAAAGSIAVITGLVLISSE